MINYQNASKKELINELEKLRNESISLRMSNEAAITNSISSQNENVSENNQFGEIKHNFELFFNSNPDAAIISRLIDGIVVNINAGFTKMTAYSLEDVIGKSSLDINLYKHPSDRQKIVEEITKHGFCDNFEAEFMRKDGSTLVGLMSAKVFLINDIQHIISITRDISLFKQSEEALHYSERKLATMLQTMVDGMVTINLEGEIIYCNAAAEQILDMSKNVLGKYFQSQEWNQIDENGKPYPPEQLPLAIVLREKRIVTNVEHALVSPTGEWKWISVNAAPLFDDNGQLAGGIASFRDFTERKRLEKEKQKTDTILSTLSQAIEQSPVTTVITDVTGNIEFVNPMFTKTTGYTAEEAIGKNPRILKAGDKTSEEYKELWDTIISGQNWYGVFKNKKKNGENYWESAVISPVKNNYGIITHFLAVKENITIRKDVEEKLRESEEKYRMIAENTSDGIILIGADTKVTYVSPSYLKQLGYSESEELERNSETILSIIHPDDREAVFAAIFNAIEQKIDALTYNYRAKHKAGHYIWREDNANFKYDSNGNMFNTYVICRDITERKRAEEKLKMSQELLRKFAIHLQNDQEEEKVLLAAKLDNELGQVLVALKMDIGILKNKILKENADNESIYLLSKLDEANNTIGNSIKATLKMMNELRYEVLYLMGFVEAVKLFSTEFQVKNKMICELVTEVEKLEIDEKLSTSLFRIFQIAMSNVSVHSKATEVKIYLSQTSSKITIEIIDNGIGFDQNRLSKSTSNGLIYMKERTSLLNGILNINSKMNQGTSIRIEIPF